MTDAPVDSVVTAIENDIIFGHLAPGTRLTEDSLMARFTATRHAIRQALVELENIGIVSRERNVGAAVRRYRPGEVLEIYAVRELLQREAALLIPAPAPPGLADRLTALNDRFRDAQHRRSLREIHETNDEFHLALLGACGNAYLLNSIRDYMRLTLPMRATSLADATAFEVSEAHHRMMIRLLGRPDRWTLAQLCVDHIQPSKQAYLDLLTAERVAA